jgi:hypothetical protein
MNGGDCWTDADRTIVFLLERFPGLQPWQVDLILRLPPEIIARAPRSDAD